MEGSRECWAIEKGPLVHLMVWGSQDDGEGEDSSQIKLTGVGDAMGELGKMSR